MVRAGETIGLSAGASAPEVLMDEVIAGFRERYDVVLEEVAVTRENIEFNVPRALM
jgi:4-hydroxy-3-methylbut-2-enyl diphosphate reductase